MESVFAPKKTHMYLPDLDSEGVHEGKESGGLPAGDLEEDGDAQIHEGLGEIDDGLSGKVDGHGPHGQVGPPVHQF